MPYIDPNTRSALDPAIQDLQQKLAGYGWQEGVLNYVITRLVAAAFVDNPRYFSIARIRGVLGNVWDEFYRRVGGPYEDSVIERNGDIKEYEGFYPSSNVGIRGLFRRSTPRDVLPSD